MREKEFRFFLDIIDLVVYYTCGKYYLKNYSINDVDTLLNETHSIFKKLLNH